MRIGLIGYGNISRTLMKLLSDELPAPLTSLTVLCLPEFAEITRQQVAEEGKNVALELTVLDNGEDFLNSSFDLIIECAGHSAVSAYVPNFLERGIDAVIVSIGALADLELENRLRKAAKIGGGQIILPAGAIGGVDILSALRPAGLTNVTYRGRKPPIAWSGTAAEQVLDLHNITEATIFFKGNARDAAQQYPKNANVAATLALAGLGFEATKVELVADPEAPGNVHEYFVESPIANYRIEIENKPSAGNAKTSVTTVYSVLRAVMNRIQPVVI
jgi:aspartate dehydrogenase